MIQQDMISEVFSIEKKDSDVLKTITIMKQKLIAILMLTKGYHIYGFQDNEIFWPMNIGLCYHAEYVKFKNIGSIDDLCLFVGYYGNKYLISAYSAIPEIDSIENKEWLEFKKKLPFLSLDTIMDWGDEGKAPAVIKYFSQFKYLAAFIDQFLENMG